MYLHIHCSSIHLQITLQYSNAVIVDVIRIIENLINHDMFPSSCNVSTFRVTLIMLLHIIDNNATPILSSTKYHPHLPQNITLPHLFRYHWSLQIVYVAWKEAPHYIHREISVILAYTYNFILTLPVSNYNRDATNIVDNICTGILVPAITNAITIHFIEYSSDLKIIRNRTHLTNIKRPNLFTLFKDLS